jgi:tripartite-type tricarboxylate transporter receptor subunit TctC
MPLMNSMRVPGAMCVTWLFLGSVAHAQDYPTRPITIVVSTAAGGITDVSTRIYAVPLSKALNQKIVVENRPTGGGTVAAIATQNAPPDGYTLLSITGVQHVAIPAMQSVAYEPVKGFTPISLLFLLPSLILVPYDSPAQSVAELLDLGRKKAGGLSVGSAGVGSTAHLLGAKLGVVTKTPMHFVQYGGGAPLMTDLITGRLDFSFSSYTAARSNIEGKKLRALAIYSETRLLAVPDVPTLKEVGLGQVRVGNWFGIVGPAGMPPAVIARLNSEIVKASRDKTVVERLTENGTIIATTSPEEMGAIMRDEAANMAELIKELGLQLK